MLSLSVSAVILIKFGALCRAALLEPFYIHIKLRKTIKNKLPRTEKAMTIISADSEIVVGVVLTVGDGGAAVGVTVGRMLGLTSDSPSVSPSTAPTGLTVG